MTEQTEQQGEHTPLPWRVRAEHKWTVEAVNGHAIAEMYAYADDPGFDNKQLTIYPEGNARHIVKACNLFPELVAIAKRVRDYHDFIAGDDSAYMVNTRLINLAKAARATLAKAEKP